MHRHALTDERWNRIEEVFDRGCPGPKSKIGDRMFIDAVLFRAKTGIPWRDLPERFGPWKSVFNRFNNWSKQGIWELMFAALDVDLQGFEEDLIVDSSVVRAQLDAAGGKGGSKATICDALEEAFRRN